MTSAPQSGELMYNGGDLNNYTRTNFQEFTGGKLMMMEQIAERHEFSPWASNSPQRYETWEHSYSTSGQCTTHHCEINRLWSVKGPGVISVKICPVPMAIFLGISLWTISQYPKFLTDIPISQLQREDIPIFQKNGQYHNIPDWANRALLCYTIYKILHV